MSARKFWMHETHNDTWFSVTDTARALRVGRNKLHELGIPTRTVARQKCYRKGDVIAWLKSPENFDRHIVATVAWRIERWRRGAAQRKRNLPSLPVEELGAGPAWDAAF